jgi:predicted aldo/keto reductase-like oxidoreductase
MSDQDKLHRVEKGISWRQFIGSSVAAAIGIGLRSQVKSFGGKNELPLSKLKIKEYRIWGRTGFKVSDIGFGSGENTDVSLVEAILDTGINYIDTAENYVRGQKAGFHAAIKELKAEGRVKDMSEKILHYYHYFKSQGREKFAISQYAKLESRKADKCQSCDGFCESACPHGVPVQGLLSLAHQTLTLA